MVNLTNPMAMKGPFRDFIPVGPHTVKLTLSGEYNVKQAKLLVAGNPVPVERSGSILTIRVPSIRDHEVLALDL